MKKFQFEACRSRCHAIQRLLAAIAVRRRHISALVTPMFTWAAPLVKFKESELSKLRADVQFAFLGPTPCDTPQVTVFALLGHEHDPFPVKKGLRCCLQRLPTWSVSTGARLRMGTASRGGMSTVSCGPFILDGMASTFSVIGSLMHNEPKTWLNARVSTGVCIAWAPMAWLKVLTYLGHRQVLGAIWRAIALFWTLPGAGMRSRQLWPRDVPSGTLLDVLGWQMMLRASVACAAWRFLPDLILSGNAKHFAIAVPWCPCLSTDAKSDSSLLRFVRRRHPEQIWIGMIYVSTWRRV